MTFTATQTTLVAEPDHDELWEKFTHDHSAMRKIYGVILRTVDFNETLAEDLFQAALAHAWEKRHQFRGESKLSTWVCRVAITVTGMYVRRVAYQRAGYYLPPALDGREETIPYENDFEGYPDPSPLWDRTGLLSIDLERALDHLESKAPRCYATFVLHYILGMNEKETAFVLGIDEGTVKSNSSKARKRLRLWLTRTPEPPIFYEECEENDQN